MPRDLRKTCFDISQAIAEIEEFTANKTFAEYKVNRMLKMAIEREYEIIGEALRRMETDFPAQFLQISDGRRIIDFRNLLAHGYDSVADEIVWSVTENNLKILKKEIGQIFEELE
ncbi:DUF86 domain-containing protein [soil metagenome]